MMESIINFGQWEVISARLAILESKTGSAPGKMEVERSFSLSSASWSSSDNFRSAALINCVNTYKYSVDES